MRKRELALKWWRKYSPEDQFKIMNKNGYPLYRYPFTLSGREIEEIYSKTLSRDFLVSVDLNSPNISIEFEKTTQEKITQDEKILIDVIISDLFEFNFKFIKDTFNSTKTKYIISASKFNLEKVIRESFKG